MFSTIRKIAAVTCCVVLALLSLFFIYAAKTQSSDGGTAKLLLIIVGPLTILTCHITYSLFREPVSKQNSKLSKNNILANRVIGSILLAFGLLILLSIVLAYFNSH